jgi:hypothetical protein
MDCFVRNLLRAKLLSVEENNFNSEEVADIIEDRDSDRWSQPVIDDDTISGINSKEKLVATTIPALNAVIGSDDSSTILHHRPQRRLDVALVSDNARCFADARSEVFRRMEDNSTQIDRWDANHSTHSNNNRVDIRREMSDSRLVIPNRRWKQQHQRFRREKSETMLVMPKRSKKQQHAVISSKEEEENEGHINGSDDDQFKHKNRCSKIVSESLQVVSWNDETNNRSTKSAMFVLELAFGELAPEVPITRSGGYRKIETTSRTA